jgi:arylsulfatase A-like enzyme
MATLNRRDFLKLTASLVGGTLITSIRPLKRLLARGSAKPNIIIILLDAMSASNLSLYGYSRPTTPNFEKFADQATVYHSHYSGSNFTTSGTASMLMGMYPWTHRAINFRGLVKRSLEPFNMFALLGDDYHRLAFSQNPWVNLLLGQVAGGVDEYLPFAEFAYRKNLPLFEEMFPSDYPMAYMAFEDFLTVNEFNQDPGSISLGLFNLFGSRGSRIKSAPKYPSGLPSNFHTYYRIEDLLSGMAGSLEKLVESDDPFLAYYHLLPPHSPYMPRRDFLGMYRNDGILPVFKPRHPLSEAHKSDKNLVRIRMTYDEYVTNLDYEFGVFIRNIESSGLLENSYLFVTSDHGELFERGEHGHGTPLMYEPVTRIPLLVRTPGQKSRVNVNSNTSNIDLLPTLLALAGQPVPSELEGRLLPGLGGREEPERGVFSVLAKESSAFLPLSKAVVTLNKSGYKLIYYRGYGDEYDGRMELYDLKDDPEEMHDLSADFPSVAKPMKEELLDALAASDRRVQQ